MADKNTQMYASLSDVAALTHNDDIVTMVDEWSKETSILDDMTYRPSNGVLDDVSGIVESMPRGQWTGIDEGVKPSKGTWKQRTEHMGLIEDLSQFNRKHEQVLGEQYELARWRQDQMHIQSMGLEIERVLLYGNPYANTKNAEHEFLGFMPRLSHITDDQGFLAKAFVDKETDMQVTKSPFICLDAGGQASASSGLCSLLFVAKGPLAPVLIYPKHANGTGLLFEKGGYHGVYDENGLYKEIAESHFMWMGGLSIPHRRAVVRIANIDVEKDGFLDTIDDLMTAAYMSIPQNMRGGLKIYANSKFIRGYKKACRKKVVPTTEGGAGINSLKATVNVGEFTVTECDSLIRDEEHVD